MAKREKGEETLKINYLALAAAIVAFAALALPWLNVTSTSDYAEPVINMEFNVYLYQLTGTVNEISQTTTANVWFLWVALALILFAGVGCLAGSFLASRKGQVLVLTAGIAALLSVVFFGAGLLNSEFANPSKEPAAVMNLFPSNAFGMTADEAMEWFYSFSWFLGYGFWLALVSAILSFVSLVTHSISTKKKTEGTRNQELQI